MFSRYAVTTFRQTGRFICRCGVSTFRSSRVLTFYSSNARTLCRFRNMGPPPRLGRPHRGVAGLSADGHHLEEGWTRRPPGCGGAAGGGWAAATFTEMGELLAQASPSVLAAALARGGGAAAGSVSNRVLAVSVGAATGPSRPRGRSTGADARPSGRTAGSPASTVASPLPADRSGRGRPRPILRRRDLPNRGAPGTASRCMTPVVSWPAVGQLA